MTRTNDFIKNYFGFNKQQRNGLFVLIVISFLLLIARIVYPVFMKPGKIVIQNLPLLERKIDSAYSASKKLYKHKVNTNHQKTILFNFDPNTVSFEQLLLLGFTQKKATTFIKFRNRGFVFKEKKDLQKVYGISTNLYADLEPYIEIKTKNDKTLTPSQWPELKTESPKQKKIIAMIELNAADSVSLESLNGIGATYSKRIIKYRNILGGFTSITQLKEVYGFSDETFQKVKPLLRVDPAGIKKINLNRDDFKTINKHPYLGYELTKSIFNQRRKVPVTAAGLREMMGNDSLYQKLLPYLSFD